MRVSLFAARVVQFTGKLGVANGQREGKDRDRE